jgi:hypothetical protein
MTTGPQPSHPGHSWTKILERPTQEAFAAAFSTTITIDTSIATRSIIGAVDLRSFFDASRAIYDSTS